MGSGVTYVSRKDSRKAQKNQFKIGLQSDSGVTYKFKDKAIKSFENRTLVEMDYELCKNSCVVKIKKNAKKPKKSCRVTHGRMMSHMNESQI